MKNSPLEEHSGNLDEPIFERPENMDTSFPNGDFTQPIFNFDSLPVNLKNNNLPFILVGLFLLYKWCT